MFIFTILFLVIILLKIKIMLSRFANSILTNTDYLPSLKSLYESPLNVNNKLSRIIFYFVVFLVCTFKIKLS